MTVSHSFASFSLQEWRGKRTWTQVQAATYLGIDQALYSKYERGARKPGRTSAVQIQERTQGAVPVPAWDMPPPPHFAASHANG